MKLAKRFIDLGYLLATGILATLTMDVIAIASVKSGIFKLGRHQIGPHLLGRWVGSFPTGRVIHSNILDTSPLPHEVAIGVASHYVIGFTLSSIFVISWLKIFARKINLSSALIFGISTCVFPYFLMFPAMGFGVMGLKTVHESMLVPFSAFNHAVFGVGIFIWTHLLSRYYLNGSKMITRSTICPLAPSSQS